MSQEILDSVIILLACSVIAVAVFRRLRIPSILGYLIVGIVVGPHGLAWIPHTRDTHFLGELGVVFLLFTVGLEFCRPQLLAMRKVVLGLGGAQVAAYHATSCSYRLASGHGARQCFGFGRRDRHVLHGHRHHATE